MPQSQKRKILVVDDELHITMLLSATLGVTGYEVVAAHDGVEALEKVNAERPDLIILDIKMPNLNGWEVCRQLKKGAQTKKIPIIIITYRGREKDRYSSVILGKEKSVFIANRTMNQYFVNIFHF